VPAVARPRAPDTRSYTSWDPARLSVVVPIGVIVAVAIVCIVVAVLSCAQRADIVAVDHAIVSLGLGMKVTAESVETADQQQFLRAAGVHSMQGYRFGRPVSFAEISARLQTTGAFQPHEIPTAGELIPGSRKDNPLPPVVASARFYDIADVPNFPTRKDIRWLPQRLRW